MVLLLYALMIEKRRFCLVYQSIWPAIEENLATGLSLTFPPFNMFSDSLLTIFEFYSHVCIGHQCRQSCSFQYWIDTLHTQMCGNPHHRPQIVCGFFTVFGLYVPEGWMCLTSALSVVHLFLFTNSRILLNSLVSFCSTTLFFN